MSENRKPKRREERAPARIDALRARLEEMGVAA
jgi:hypothetical protein